MSCKYSILAVFSGFGANSLHTKLLQALVGSGNCKAANVNLHHREKKVCYFVCIVLFLLTQQKLLHLALI